MERTPPVKEYCLSASIGPPERPGAESPAGGRGPLSLESGAGPRCPWFGRLRGTGLPGVLPWPTARRDRPTLRSTTTTVRTLTRVTGSTFEHSFPLPKPANAGPGAARKRKFAKPNGEDSSTLRRRNRHIADPRNLAVPHHIQVFLRLPSPRPRMPCHTFPVYREAVCEVPRIF